MENVGLRRNAQVRLVMVISIQKIRLSWSCIVGGQMVNMFRSVVCAFYRFFIQIDTILTGVIEGDSEMILVA